MSDFIRAEGGDVIHRIGSINGTEVTTVCGRVIDGERVSADDGKVCARCGGEAQ